MSAVDMSDIATMHLGFSLALQLFLFLLLKLSVNFRASAGLIPVHSSLFIKSVKQALKSEPNKVFECCKL